MKRSSSTNRSVPQLRHPGGITAKPDHPLRGLTGLVLILSVLGGAIPAAPGAWSRTVQVAVVRDGDPAREDVAALIETELDKLVAHDVDVRFMDEPRFNADWDASRAADVLTAALDDPRIDYVLTMGVLTSQEAARPERSLSKPVISAFVQFGDLYGTPYDPDGGSLKPNYNFAIVPGGVRRDLREYEDLENFEVLYVAVDEVVLSALESAPSALDAWSEELGMRAHLWPVSTDPIGSVENLGPDAGAVLLGELPRLSDGQRTELVSVLTARGIRTFSLLGAPDVERGVLASFATEITQPLVRRIALNLDQLIRGESVESLPVTLSRETRLTLNGRTAAALGIVPSARVRAYAHVIHPEALVPEGSPLSLQGVLKLVQESNLNLAIERAETERARSASNVARSPLLPQIGLSADYLSQGPGTRQLWPWTQRFWGGVSASQMLYDDAWISDYRSSRRQYEGQQANRESVRLDVMSRSATEYLHWVLATVLYRVQIANLQLTEENRNLAQTRYELGYSGRDEVFRWNAQLAESRSAVLDAGRLVESRRIRLNQELGIAQERQWQPQEIEVDPDRFPFLDGAVDTLYTRAQLWEHFRNFLLAYALFHSPDIRSVDLYREAQSIQLGQRKRRWFLPRLQAQVNYGRDFWRSADPAALDRYTYFIGVSAEYPLFTGLERGASVGRLRAEVQALEHQTQLTSDLVERRTRTALERVQASFPSIRLTREAAENARRNLEVVQENYAEGAVEITRMLEAQNASFQAEQSAVASTYQFLIDLIEVQRAISWFELDQTPESRAEFLRQAERYVSDPPRPDDSAAE